MSLLDFFVLVCGILAVVMGLMVTFLPNILHAAIALVFSLIAVAGFYAALGADFLAAAQFVIYIGATIIVIIFAIMMTPHIYKDRFIEGWTKYLLPTALAAIMCGSLVAFIRKTPWMGLGENNREVTTALMGRALMGPYALIYEFTAVLLLVGLVAAVVVARHKKLPERGE